MVIITYVSASTCELPSLPSITSNVLFHFFVFFVCIYYTSNSIGALHRGIISVDSFSMFHPKSPAVHREREKYWEITARSWKTNSGEDGFPNCFYIHLQCIYMDIKFGYLPVAFQWSLKSVFIDQWLSQLSLFFNLWLLSIQHKTTFFLFSQFLLHTNRIVNCSNHFWGAHHFPRRRKNQLWQLKIWYNMLPVLKSAFIKVLQLWFKSNTS